LESFVDLDDNVRFITMIMQIKLINNILTLSISR